MRVRDLAYETMLALDANRARSLLTVLGVVIGISAVIAMIALIGGVKQSMVSEMGLGQARLVSIGYYYNQGFSISDVEALSTEMADDYEYVTPVAYGGAEVVSDTAKVSSGQIQGVQAEYQQAMGLTLAQGRFFSEQEASSGALVVVLDQTGVKGLFGKPDADAVGKSVRINGAEYSVVGVVESSVQANTDYATFYLPFLTCCNRINGNQQVGQVYGFAREDSDMDTVALHTQDWLVRHFGIPEDQRDEYIWVQTMESVIRELDSMLMSFQVLMTSVASISLVVGGIGIMNMMLTNVTERIREIGLRKALGARRRDITRQFLLESICLTLAGGALGMILGYLGSFALAGLAGGMFGAGGESGVTPYIDFGSMLMVAAICVAIGIVFGYYPARRAARLDPVESLHYQ